FPLGLLGVLILLRAKVMRPIYDIGDALRGFGAGDREARAPVRGASELREVGWRFNEMANALARQREHQLSFLAGGAPDLENPPAALRLVVGSLRPERPLPPEPRVRQALGLVGRQVDRLDRMVGDLLDTARIEAGRLDLRLEERDASELIREAFTLFAGTSPAHRLTLSLPP